jgi:hypothetical protein
MSENFKKPQRMEELVGDHPRAFIGITLLSSGSVKVEGSITDLAFAETMLKTAGEVVKSYHARKRMEGGGPVFVPLKDTPLAGTPDEKRLVLGRA